MTAVPVLARTIKYAVKVIIGETSKESFVFDKPVVTVGRGPENDIAFTNDPKVSRSHVEIRIEKSQLHIKNISGKNFILIDDERIDEKTVQTEAKLQVGDSIVKITIEAPSSASKASPMALVKTEANPVGGGLARSSMPAPGMGSPLSHPHPYGSPHPGAYQPPPKRPRGQRVQTANGGGSRLRFYMIVAIVLGGGYWFLTSGTGPKKAEIGLRTEGDIVRSIEQSAGALEQLRKQKEASGQDSLQYKTAQEHYVRGFRDYRNGQYGRAIESFQAALSFFPSHELARKYLMESQKKFDEMVKFHMNQGRKYYGKSNYRLCRSSFANVLIMVKRTDDKIYQEARQYYNECSMRLEGRY